MGIEELLELKIDSDTDILRQNIKKNWDRVAKPLDGLGLLEDMICTAGAAQQTGHPELTPRALVIMCADNGIVEEGISQSGQEVTLAVAKNMAGGKSSACKMAQSCNTDVFAVDIGINSDEPICGRLSDCCIQKESQTGKKDEEQRMKDTECLGRTVFLNKKIMHGTRNFAKEPAMTRKECMQAISTGIELAGELAKKGCRILATGEMGIGNTTTSAAVACALLGLSPEEIAGRGAGLDDAGLLRKQNVIRTALKKYGYYSQKNPSQEKGKSNPVSRFPDNIKPGETFEILRTLGGLDIAGLCGIFIGGAMHHVPVVIDGLISSAAALCAERLVFGTEKYMLASHCGKEPGMKYILDELGLNAPIHARLALGEGTGALMIFPLLDMALEVYESGGSFDDIGVKQYKRLESAT